MSEQIDDGLPISEVGIWGEYKYRMIRNYCDLFTNAMRGKWDHLVYIDLFSGSGLVKLRDTNKLAYGSPMISLGLKVQFDSYIFCDASKTNLDTLRKRVEKAYPHIDVNYVVSDVNKAVDKIHEILPRPSKSYTVLCLCLSDPFRMSNLNFNTIKKLSNRFMDHLVLIPTYMDANRNIKVYLKPNNKRIFNFTGIKDWREQWAEVEAKGVGFDIFLTDCYGASLERDTVKCCV